MLKVLEGFGLSQEDAKVYIYLAKTNPQRGRDLAVGLKMTKRQLSPILKNLREKGLVTSSSKCAGLLSAVAFEALLDLYVKINVEQAQIIRESKEELLTSWRHMTTKDNT